MAIQDLNDKDLKEIGASGAPPKVVLAYKKLARFMNVGSRKAWLKERSENWDAVAENKFFTDEELTEMRRMKQPPVSINKLVKGVQGSAAIVTASTPTILFNPTGSGDLYVAELLKRGHDVVFAKNEAQDTIYAVVEERAIGGISFFDVRHNASRGLFGRIIIEESDPTIFYWDEASRKADFSDTDIIKAQLRTKTYIKEHYDDIKDEDLSFQRELIEDTGEGITDTKKGEDNYTIPPPVDPDVGNTKPEIKDIWEMELWELRTVKEDWVIIQMEGQDPEPVILDLKKGQKVQDVIKDDILEQPGVVGATHWPRRLEKRVLTIIVGKKIIKQTNNRGERDDNGELKQVDEVENPHDADADGDPVLPIIGLKGQRTRNSYAKSPTTYARPINMALCKREAQFIYAASAALNSPIVRDDSAKWSGEIGVPGTELVISQNTAIKPYRLPPENLNLSNISYLIAENKADINEQYDLTEVMKGGVPEGQESMSGRLALALQDFGTLMSKPNLRSLESALVRLAKVDIAIMLKTWPRQMWERLLEKTEWNELTFDQAETDLIASDEDTTDLEKEIQIRWEEALERIRPRDTSKPPGISLIDLDVVMTAGSSLPTNRMAKEGAALEKFNAGLYDRKAALEYSDDPKAKEIDDRMAQAEQAEAEQELIKSA